VFGASDNAAIGDIIVCRVDDIKTTLWMVQLSSADCQNMELLERYKALSATDFNRACR
jgi:hypothetical protein